MALDGTYNGLRAAISDRLHRPDLNSSIPDYIAFAHAEIARRIVDRPPPQMIGKVTLTLDDEYVDTPVDFMGVRSFNVTSATALLHASSSELIADYKAQFPSQSGTPTDYAIVGTQFQFWPAPTSGTATLVYLKRLEAPGVNVPTNWLLTLNPDCYFYGALVHSGLSDYRPQFEAAMAAIVAIGVRASTGPLIAMPINLSVV